MSNKRIVNLSEMQAKKNGDVTPLRVLNEVQSLLEGGDITKLMYISLNSDGNVVAGWSTTDSNELLGMIEVGKQLVLNDVFD